MFVFGLFIFLELIGLFANIWFDPSVLEFYPLMAGVGALFGFERWWTYQNGPVNPFHG